MWAYIVRRILWTIPIVLGVMLLTFTLFSLVSKDPARQYAGKRATTQVLEATRHQMGLDKAVWFHVSTPISSIQTDPAKGIVTINTAWAHGLEAGDEITITGVDSRFDGSHRVDAVVSEKIISYTEKPGGEVIHFVATDTDNKRALPKVRAASTSRILSSLFDSQFFDTLLFRFNPSIRYGETVGSLFWRKAPVSLAIQLPVFIIELGIQLVLALFVATNRGRWPDYVTTFLAILGMSVPALSIYLGAQWLFAAHWRIFPVAGWDVGFYAVQFAVLPILVSVLGGIGGGTRFYRTVVLEEINADYVRTARSKGVASRDVLLTHVMRNVMIPVLTNTVATLPYLLMGALILERLFQIPGAGGLLVEAIFNGDRNVVMALTYALSIVYCIMLLVTDICYTLVDPRVKLA